MQPKSNVEKLQNVRLYVGGLYSEVTEKDISQRFKGFGSVQRVFLNDSLNKYAFIDLLSTEKQIMKCISIYNNTKWKGNTLKIEKSVKETYQERLLREQKSIQQQKHQKLQNQNVGSNKQMKRLLKRRKVLMSKEMDLVSDRSEKKGWVIINGRNVCLFKVRDKNTNKIVTIKPNHRSMKQLNSSFIKFKPISKLNWDSISELPFDYSNHLKNDNVNNDINQDVDEIKHDAEQNEIKENEIKEDEIKEDEIKEDEIKEDEIKEDEIKEDVKQEDVKQEDVKLDDTNKNKKYVINTNLRSLVYAGNEQENQINEKEGFELNFGFNDQSNNINPNIISNTDSFIFDFTNQSSKNDNNDQHLQKQSKLDITNNDNNKSSNLIDPISILDKDNFFFMHTLFNPNLSKKYLLRCNNDSTDNKNKDLKSLFIRQGNDQSLIDNWSLIKSDITKLYKRNHKFALRNRKRYHK